MQPSLGTDDSSSKGKFFDFRLKSCHVITVKPGNKKYKCDVCGGIYRHAFSLKRHFLRTHINYKYLSEADITNCNISLRKLHFNQIGSSQDEPTIDEHPNDGDTTSKTEALVNVYKCHLCSHFFNLSNQLKSHLGTHTNGSLVEGVIERPFSCKRCTMTFSHRQKLVRHMSSVHTSGHAYSCKYCCKVLLTKVSKKRHEQLHERFKPFHCEHCPSSFIHSWELRSHTQMAHPTSFYPCLHCTRHFSSSSFLDEHIRQHHRVPTLSSSPPSPFKDTLKDTFCCNSKDNPQNRDDSDCLNAFSCPICKKKFPSQLNLARHQRRAHPARFERDKKVGSLSFRQTEEEFYQSLAQCISENLLYFVDGKCSSFKGNYCNNIDDDDVFDYLQNSLPNAQLVTVLDVSNLSKLNAHIEESKNILNEANLYCSSDSDLLDLTSQSTNVLHPKLLPPSQPSTIYICTVCAIQLHTLKEMEEHKLNNHVNVHCTHIEIEGGEHNIPPGLCHYYTDPTGFLHSFDTPEASPMICSKCNSSFSETSDFHAHILECAIKTPISLEISNNATHSCSSCNLSFSKIIDLNKHLENCQQLGSNSLSGSTSDSKTPVHNNLTENSESASHCDKNVAKSTSSSMPLEDIVPPDTLSILPNEEKIKPDDNTTTSTTAKSKQPKVKKFSNTLENHSSKAPLPHKIKNKFLVASFKRKSDHISKSKNAKMIKRALNILKKQEKTKREPHSSQILTPPNSSKDDNNLTFSAPKRKRGRPPKPKNANFIKSAPQVLMKPKDTDISIKPASPQKLPKTSKPSIKDSNNTTIAPNSDPDKIIFKSNILEDNNDLVKKNKTGSSKIDSSNAIQKANAGIEDKLKPESLSETFTKRCPKCFVHYYSALSYEKHIANGCLKRVENSDSLSNPASPFNGALASNQIKDENSFKNMTDDDAEESKIQNDTENQLNYCTKCKVYFTKYSDYQEHLKKSSKDCVTGKGDSRKWFRRDKNSLQIQHSMMGLLLEQTKQNNLLSCEVDPGKPISSPQVSFKTFSCSVCHKIFLSYFKLLQHEMDHALNKQDSDKSINSEVSSTRSKTDKPQEDALVSESADSHSSISNSLSKQEEPGRSSLSDNEKPSSPFLDEKRNNKSSSTLNENKAVVMKKSTNSSPPSKRSSSNESSLARTKSNRIVKRTPSSKIDGKKHPDLSNEDSPNKASKNKRKCSKSPISSSKVKESSLLNKPSSSSSKVETLTSSHSHPSFPKGKEKDNGALTKPTPATSKGKGGAKLSSSSSPIKASTLIKRIKANSSSTFKPSSKTNLPHSKMYKTRNYTRTRLKGVKKEG